MDFSFLFLLMLPIESVIYIIQYCLNKSLQDCSFEQGSYLKWTVNELLDRLRENPEVTPLIIIKDFRNQMEEYSKVNPDTSLVFNSGKDLAEWIINLLIA